VRKIRLRLYDNGYPPHPEISIDSQFCKRNLCIVTLLQNWDLVYIPLWPSQPSRTTLPSPAPPISWSFHPVPFPLESSIPTKCFLHQNMYRRPTARELMFLRYTATEMMNQRMRWSCFHGISTLHSRNIFANKRLHYQMAANPSKLSAYRSERVFIGKSLKKIFLFLSSWCNWGSIFYSGWIEIWEVL